VQFAGLLDTALRPNCSTGGSPCFALFAALKPAGKEENKKAGNAEKGGDDLNGAHSRAIENQEQRPLAHRDGEEAYIAFPGLDWSCVCRPGSRAGLLADIGFLRDPNLVNDAEALVSGCRRCGNEGGRRPGC
jgi:hypothetical protein